MSDLEKHYSTDNVSYTYGAGARVRIYDRPKGLKGLYQHPVTQVCMLGECPQ